MAIETKCQTPGAVFHTLISPKHVSVGVTLPFPLDLSKEQATLLESNLHNAVEMVLSRFFQPAYQHDCNSCTFLGRYEYDAPHYTEEQGEYTKRLTADLWFCEPAIPFPTCIARFSSEGANYSSCPVNLVERDMLPRFERGERMSTTGPAIVEAYRRVKEIL